MDVWASGEIYESYVGRWSRQVAKEFLAWLDQPDGLRWMDVGCGTGALTSTILSTANPSEVLSLDPSPGFLDHARKTVQDERVRFEVRGAEDLPDESVDVVVAGLALNFVPDRIGALRRMRTIGKTVAVYVWDYADQMQLMKYFWDAALDLRPEDAAHDEGARFPFCNPEGLERLFSEAGLSDITTRAIDIPTVFTSFDDYWNPFLGGQGPGPAYLRALEQPAQDALREELQQRLPVAEDGSIHLIARAWAARGSS